MRLEISNDLMGQIHSHLEEAYPGEGAGFLLGNADGDLREVAAILKLANTREESARHNRYLLTPQDMLHSEQAAAQRGLDVLGVFHSHPDCPNVPSEFDREWALPWFSYIIVRVDNGVATNSRSWRLVDDRSKFEEDEFQVTG